MYKKENSKEELDQKVIRDIERRRGSLGRPTITRSEVQTRVKAGDALIIIEGMVFDVSTYVNKHPGGAFILRNNYGRDSSEKFLRIHSKYAHQELLKFYIGDIGDSTNDVKDGIQTSAESEHKVNGIAKQPEQFAQGGARSPRYGEYYEHEADLSKPSSDIQFSIDPLEIRANLIVGETEISAKAFHLHSHPF
eukprot:759115-Hanusia_phi.AAC.1